MNNARVGVEGHAVETGQDHGCSQCLNKRKLTLIGHILVGVESGLKLEV